MIKINAFQYINGLDEKRISYTYSKLDEQGNILKSNIRKSTIVPVSNIEETEAIEKLVAFLIAKEEE